MVCLFADFVHSGVIIVVLHKSNLHFSLPRTGSPKSTERKVYGAKVTLTFRGKGKMRLAKVRVGNLRVEVRAKYK